MKPYDSSNNLCRRCGVDAPSAEALREYLDAYAASLPDEIRAPESVYRSRLAACEKCERRALFTCLECGCYVQARAAKRALGCPFPGAPRWRELI